jgi:predicted CopG family antitoxin
MARQISVSEEVYSMLSKVKGERSFSEVIKSFFQTKKKKKDITDFFGVMKRSKSLEQLKIQIQKDRERNYGREFKQKS